MPRYYLTKLSVEGFWPAAGFVDTEKRCFMKPEVGYGEASIQS